MKPNSLLLPLVMAFLWLLSTGDMLFASSLPGVPDGCNTRCHRSKAREDFVHGPVRSDDCIACHNPTGLEHPKKPGAFRLAAEGANLCYLCHDRMADGKVVHPPVAAGSCLDCHDVHQSPYRMLLKSDGVSLCFGCHDAEKFKARHPHAPVASGNCLGCHDPHRSDNRALLRGDGSALCFICHDKKMAEGVSIHGPVAAGRCLDCHSPHGSPYPNILKNIFPTTFYLPYAQEHFALCFDCHDRELAQDRRTDTITGFRNGDHNLHHLHINKPDKGRSCKTCHDPHGAWQPRLIKNRIPGFGSWEIPIRYMKTDNGGSCVAGCHKPKSYDRIRAVRNP